MRRTRGPGASSDPSATSCVCTCSQPWQRNVTSSGCGPTLGMRPATRHGLAAAFATGRGGQSGIWTWPKLVSSATPASTQGMSLGRAGYRPLAPDPGLARDRRCCAPSLSPYSPRGFGRRPTGPPRTHAFHAQRRHQEGRARLFRRARHLHHPEVAADHLWLRGRHLHRRPRPGRGACARAREGAAAGHQAGKHLHRGPARGIRARLRVPDVPRQHAVRGAVPARHLDRAAADRQEADRDRPQGRRRRGGAWRDRQGQRPGALRARLLRARSVDQDRRAVARMELQGPRGPAGVRARAPDSDRQGQGRRGAVLGRRQPAALLLGGQGAGGPGEGSAGGGLSAHRLADGGARQADRGPDRIRARRRRRASTASRCRRPRSSRSSMRSARRTASAASTWWRTVLSA